MKKAAKGEEVAAEHEQIGAKTPELLDNNEKRARFYKDAIDTNPRLTAEGESLTMLKDECSITESAWEKRAKTKALKIVSGSSLEVFGICLTMACLSGPTVQAPSRKAPAEVRALHIVFQSLVQSRSQVGEPSLD